MSDMTNDFGDAAQSAAKAAGSRIEGTIEAASDRLRSGADSVREGAREAGDAVNRVGRGAARVLRESTDYVRGSDAQDMLSDVRALAQKHPGKSLLAVATIGFLLGRAIRKAD